MQFQDFLNAVSKMRHHQKAYFKDRKISDLTAAKEFERVVDNGLAEGVTVLDLHEEHLPEEPKQSSLFE